MGRAVTYQDYYDWWGFSGIGAGPPYYTTVHAELRRHLSPAGVACVLVADLLERTTDEDGEPVIDDRTYPFDPEPYQPHRDLMADAVEAVGAARLARDLRVAVPPPPDPVDLILDPAGARERMYERLFTADTAPAAPAPEEEVETHAELRWLLEAFAARHQADLVADIARHGDPRKRPGFNRRRARIEGESRSTAVVAAYHIERVLPRLRAELEKLKDLVAQGGDPAEVRRQARAVRELLAEYRDADARPALSPAARAWFSEANAVLKGLAAPRPARGARKKPAVAVHPTFAALGRHKVVGSAGEVHVEWADAPALAWPVASSSLRLSGDQTGSAAVAEAWERLRARVAGLVPAVRESLLRGFREGGLEALDSPLTTENVLDEVREVGLGRTEGGVWELSFALAGDDEHGWEIFVDDHGTVWDSLGALPVDADPTQSRPPEVNP